MNEELIAKCKETAEIFVKATGLETKLISEDGNLIYEAECDKCNGSICNHVSSDACKASHLFGAQQALLFNGSYIFFCPIGLVHFVSPIIYQGQMVGALISGHILMVEPDVYLIRHLLKYVNDEKAIKDFVENVKVMMPKQVSGMAELLKLVVANLSDGSKLTKRIVEKNDISQARHRHSVYKVINSIKTNYMNKITLEDMAEQVYFTPQYLSKIFKQETGYTFKQYVCLIRVEASKKLLAEDELSHAEIAYIIGFSDQSHFSKTFKKIVGISPKIYRLSNKVYN